MQRHTRKYENDSAKTNEIAEDRREFRRVLVPAEHCGSELLTERSIQFNDLS